MPSRPSASSGRLRRPRGPAAQSAATPPGGCTSVRLRRPFAWPAAHRWTRCPRALRARPARCAGPAGVAALRSAGGCSSPRRPLHFACVVSALGRCLLPGSGREDADDSRAPSQSLSSMSRDAPRPPWKSPWRKFRPSESRRRRCEADQMLNRAVALRPWRPAARATRHSASPMAPGIDERTHQA